MIASLEIPRKELSVPNNMNLLYNSRKTLKGRSDLMANYLRTMFTPSDAKDISIFQELLHERHNHLFLSKAQQIIDANMSIHRVPQSMYSLQENWSKCCKAYPSTLSLRCFGFSFPPRLGNFHRF